MSAARPRIGVLALGTFAIGTDGFVIAGVLPGIARDTGATLADAGLLVTAFALVYAVAAPQPGCAARAAAENEIRKAAIDDGILNSAQQNAESYLTRLFSQLGFVDVIFQEATPVPED